MEDIDKLFSRVNFDSPLLDRSIGEAYKKNDADLCINGLVKHFASRTSPHYFFTANDVTKIKDDRIIDDAEAVMRHFIYGYQFDGNIDWHFNPTADTSADNEWSWSLFRTIYWQPLARAYALTRDEKYAREFISQLKAFAAAWPVEPFFEAGPNFGHGPDTPAIAWRTIEAGIRIYTTWLPCYIVFRTSPSWDRGGWITFLNLIHDHAEFLAKNYSNHEHSSNWLTMEATALLQMGIMFPEMKNAENWKILGYRRVMYETKYSFDNDGVHMERTPIYHMVSAISFLQGVRLCMINNIPVPPYALPTLVKSGEFLMKLVKPDFSTPMIGDADRNDLLARRSDEATIYEGMNLSFDPYDLNEMRAFFRVLGEITGREDLRWFGTKREQGHEPAERNYALTDAGVYVMRTGWSPEDSYMLVTGVQLERGEKSTHSHNDTGHVEISIHGEDIIIDTGRYIYNSSKWRDWRKYFISANAHNTLYVDNRTMGEVPDTIRQRGVRTYCHNFVETPLYQLIDISHNGYAFMSDPVFHRRRVIRLAGDIFVIDDRVTGLGLGEHDFRLYFNFAPGELERDGEHAWKYRSISGKEYRYTSIINEGVGMSVLKGSEEPKGGWISFGYPVKVAAPQLRLCTIGSVPLRFISVLSPAAVAVKGKADINGAVLRLSGETEIELKLEGDEGITVRLRKQEKNAV
jgi:hypothetical protein